MQKHHWIIGLALAISGAVLALTFRFEMTNVTPDGTAYVLDRWTGSVKLVFGKSSYQVKPKD